VKNKGWKCLGPSYYVFPNHPESYTEQETNYTIQSDDGWYIALVIPSLHNEVQVQLDTYPSKWNKHRELFGKYSSEITDLIDTHGMSIWASRNSMFREETPAKFDDLDQIQRILQQKCGQGGFKRLRIGWSLDMENKEPGELVADAANKMEALKDMFYKDGQRRSSY
jgi:hypothetical protein